MRIHSFNGLSRSQGAQNELVSGSVPCGVDGNRRSPILGPYREPVCSFRRATDVPEPERQVPVPVPRMSLLPTAAKASASHLLERGLVDAVLGNLGRDAPP